jgi:predicted transposase YdaD
VPKPFDATAKYLVETQPEDWLEYLGLPRSTVEVIEADLSTVTASADKVLRMREPNPAIAHVELQAGYDRELGERTLEYSVLLKRRHRLPIQSIIVLLRPEADGPEMTGVVEHRRSDGYRYLFFEYDVVRTWQKPVEAVLTGGLGTLPMAPLADVSPSALPAVIRRMEERISQETSPADAGLLWTATYVLMGLRYSPALATQLLQGVRAMKESATYQAIIQEGREVGREEGREEGRVEEARAILLRQGTKRFGPPAPQAQAALEAITAIDRLELMSERLLDVESWAELLAG